MEPVSLLQTPIRSRKDIVRVLRQARQLAKLLRLPLLDQIEIGCQAFALAADVASLGWNGAVAFQLGEGCLLIGSVAATENVPGTHRIQKRLPEPMEMSREDFAWVIAQLHIFMKVDALEVIRQQNEEMIELLRVLQGCRTKMEAPRQTESKSPAA